MEEGRRMFQIFAARMFEQRVLNAYREKVARERQEKLLEELADESRLDAQREAKKAKEAQKKKDKKKQQKAAKEEERLRREEQRAKEEAAVKAAEERKLEEQRQRKEEQRKKREAEKKAQDEERQRKETERQKKLQEARDQQAEAERKQRELKERERKRKDDAKKKEREEREAKEKEKWDRELAEKQRDAKAKAEREAKERAKREESTKQPVQQAPIPIPPLVRKGTSPAVPNISSGTGSTLSSHVSPRPQVVAPSIPKAPTPIKSHQAPRQDSHHSSPKSANVRTESSAVSPSFSQHQAIPPTSPPGPKNIPQSLSLPQQPTMPTSLPPIAPPPGMSPFPYSGMTNSPAMGGSGLSSFVGPMPGVNPRGPSGHDQSSYASQPYSAPPHRGFATPSTIGFPPGIGGIRQMPVGRGSPIDTPVSQAPIGSGLNHGSMPQPSHSRQTSASFENPGPPQTQPIGRPNPIKRPSSIPQPDERRIEVDDLSKHLGSSALLDDTDDALGISHNDSRVNRAPGGQRPGRLAFGGPSMFPDSIGCKLTLYNLR